MKYPIEEIKEKITCTQYMQDELGQQIIGSRCKSFRSGAKNATSMMCNDRDWFDFGSDEGGDVIDLCAAHMFNGNKGDAIRYLAGKAGISGESIENINVVFNTYTAILEKATEFYVSKLPRTVRTYLNKRGIEDKTITRLRIGWSENPRKHLVAAGYDDEQIANSGLSGFINRIIFPYIVRDKVTYMVGRNSPIPNIESNKPECKYVKLARNEVSEHPIWGIDTLTRPGRVVLAEGILDAISCEQDGHPVLSAITGRYSTEQTRDLITALRGREVIICLDYDPITQTGQKATTKLAEKLWEAGIKVWVVELQGKGQKVDLNELYATGKKVKDILEDQERYTQVMVSRIAKEKDLTKKQHELYSFLRKCARKMEWPDVADLIEKIKGTDFGVAWLAEVVKIIKKAPPEDQIVKELLEKHQLLYTENLGFFEYKKGCWKTRMDTEIEGWISDILGSFSTGRALSSALRQTKAKTISTITLNDHPGKINFRNGMLNVETGELLEHNPDYHSTIQLDFNYDKKAICPAFKMFIAEITDFVLERQNLLQEIFGYSLTGDVRYQKAFVFIGRGANGKSVLLEVLSDLVGKDNVSNVEISALNEPFQRISLYGKLINIGAETQSDVKGTEATFKQIVAGDTINGCKKGKDFVTWNPFVKMVFAANEFPITHDLSYGFLRRLMFLDFPMAFMDKDELDPTRKNHRLKDPQVIWKLKKELPGIINWALEGLKRLRKKDKFTVAPDQEKMMNEFVLQSNPIKQFLEEEDYVSRGSIARQELYLSYRKWCGENGRHPVSTNRFWRVVRDTANIDDTKSNGERYIQVLGFA